MATFTSGMTDMSPKPSSWPPSDAQSLLSIIWYCLLLFVVEKV